MNYLFIMLGIGILAIVGSVVIYLVDRRKAALRQKRLSNAFYR